jgi:hypothetical protein
MKNFISMRRGLLGGGRATAEGLIESGTALIGSPKTVLAGIERMRERTGVGILVALHSRTGCRTAAVGRGTTRLISRC